MGEAAIYDLKPTPTRLLCLCARDTAKLGMIAFELCEEANDRPLRLYIGRPGLQQDVILFNFFIE